MKYINDNFMLIIGLIWLILYFASLFSSEPREYSTLIIANVFFAAHSIVIELRNKNV